MLCAKLKATGERISAELPGLGHGPFVCPDCQEEVILKAGLMRTNHFANVNPVACKFATGESEEHRRCKLEVFHALRKCAGVENVMLEKSMGTIRPDVCARIRGVLVGIEIQISSLSLETIAYRTREYSRKGMYVLWLPQWTPYLDGERYRPRLWEKWIHAGYFGRVYYWVKDLEIASYTFDPHFSIVPQSSWHSEHGKVIVAGGYARRSKRYRTATREHTLHLAADFAPCERALWKSGDLSIPPAKLFMHREIK